MHPGYTIRTTRTEDTPALPQIELAASAQFADYGWEGEQILEDAFSAADHCAYIEQGRSWVAVDSDDRPVGFAVVSVVDGHAHLDEIDVHPDHGRRGIGRTLVARVCEWARASGYHAITLTTERDIPWNAPFYTRLDFRILSPDELSEGLRAILTGEAEWARDPATRVAMQRDLGD